MRKKGIIVITVLIILLLGSIFVDGFKLYLFEIQDFDKAASLALQIQATIAPLGIALISYLTSKNNENYYGISLSEYVLNRINKPLTSKVVIISELVLISISFFLYCFEYFNTVVTIFVLLIILTIYLFSQVSIVFKAKPDIRRILFKTVLEKSKNEERMISDFFDSFNETISSQSIEVINEYREKANQLFLNLLISGTKENYRLFCNKLGATCDTLLKSKTQHKINTAIEILLTTFKQYRDSGKSTQDFDPNIINQCQIGICEAFEQINDNTKIEKLCLHLPLVIMGAEITDNRKGPDVSPWFSLAKAFGYLACKNSNQLFIREMIPNTIDSFLFSEQYREKAYSELLHYKTCFAISVLKNGKASLLYEDGINKLIKRNNYLHNDNEQINTYLLTIIIYSLYICVFENQVAIPDSTKQECMLIASKLWKHVRNTNEKLIYSKRLSLNEYEKKLLEVLRFEEWFSDDEAKFVVMDYAIRESLIIIFAICTSIEPFYDSLLEEYIGNNGFSFYSIIGNKENACTKIKETIELLRDEAYLNSTVENNVAYIDNLYFIIKRAIENGYKKGEIYTAIETERELGDLKPFDERICSLFQSEILEKVSALNLLNTNMEESVFSSRPISFDYSIPLLFYQNDNVESLNSTYTNLLVKLFFEQIDPIAQQKTINPNNEDDMNVFFALLCKNDTVIGSEPFIKYEKQAITEQYKKIISTKKTLISSFYPNKMILLDSSLNSFRFTDFSVTSRKYTKEEILSNRTVQKINEGLYSCNITNDIWLTFTEEELLQYYSADKRIIHFSCTEHYILKDPVIIQFTR